MYTSHALGRIQRSVIATLLGAAALALSAGMPASAYAGTSASVEGGVWQYNYKDDYFTSSTTCNNWGYGAVTPGYSWYIPGVVNYQCHLDPGESRWSIDLYWLT